MSTPTSPRKKRPNPIWGRYSPTCLAVFGTLSTLLLLVILASWLPPYEIAGATYYEQPVQYLPSGVGLGFIIIAGRQLYLRKRHRQAVPAPTPRAASADHPDGTKDVPSSAQGPAIAAYPAVSPPGFEALESSAQANDHDDTNATNSGIGWLLGVGAAMVVVAIAIGFGRGYDHEVVVEEAQEEIVREVSTGTFKVVETSEWICGVGEDFQYCLGQHIAVYNANCAEKDLEVFSAIRCNQFLEFLDNAEAMLQGCGFGCITTSESDTWGWRYLTVEPAMTLETEQEAREEVTELRRCYFDLGAIAFGDCGIDPSHRQRTD